MPGACFQKNKQEAGVLRTKRVSAKINSTRGLYYSNKGFRSPRKSVVSLLFENVAWRGETTRCGVRRDGKIAKEKCGHNYELRLDGRIKITWVQSIMSLWTPYPLPPPSLPNSQRERRSIFVLPDLTGRRVMFSLVATGFVGAGSACAWGSYRGVSNFKLASDRLCCGGGRFCA